LKKNLWKKKLEAQAFSELADEEVSPRKMSSKILKWILNLKMNFSKLNFKFNYNLNGGIKW